MKTLYESILDDESVLINNANKHVNSWFNTLKSLLSNPSCNQKDIINVFKSEGFQKDIMSTFRDRSEIEIKTTTWEPLERHIGIFDKHQRIMYPGIEFCYCDDLDIYGNTNFVMKIDNFDGLNTVFANNVKSKQIWSAIPNKLCKKYKLNKKSSPFVIGEMLIY